VIFTSYQVIYGYRNF